MNKQWNYEEGLLDGLSFGDASVRADTLCDVRESTVTLRHMPPFFYFLARSSMKRYQIAGCKACPVAVQQTVRWVGTFVKSWL